MPPNDDILPPGGTPLEPGLLRRVLLAVLARTRVEGAHGVVVTALPGGGSLVGLDTPREAWLPARITAAPAFAPTAPAQCVYTAQAYANEGVTLTDALPGLGRPTVNDEWMLWPARVGDPCFIVRQRQAGGDLADKLWIATEAVAKKPCP